MLSGPSSSCSKLEGPINRRSPGAEPLSFSITVLIRLAACARHMGWPSFGQHASHRSHEAAVMSCAAVLQVKACSPGVELASSRRGKTPTPDTMLIPKKNRKEVYKYLFKGEHSLIRP